MELNIQIMLSLLYKSCENKNCVIGGWFQCYGTLLSPTMSVNQS